MPPVMKPTPKTPDTKRGRERRGVRNVGKPVESILPREVLDELSAAVQAVPAVTPELVAELGRRFAIEERYGVSRRRLSSLLKRMRGAGEARAKNHHGMTQRTGREAPADRLRGYRVRQASVASILEATFGSMAECRTDLWDRRAYLMLVGLVYERLAVSEDELPTAELVALAKVLAEAKRAYARGIESERRCSTDDQPEPPQRRLPESFADVVRQVYGTNFHEADEG